MFNDIEMGKKYFIFNINSSEVSGALVYFDNENSVPVIEYSVKSEMEISNNLSAENFKKNTKTSLLKILELLENYINITGEISKIDKAFVFLSSPWSRKNIHNLVDERIEPFEITDKYLESFLENGGQMRENEDLLKAEIISLKANGYDVNISDILDKKILKLEILLMDSYIDIDDKNLISETILKKFSFLDISYSTFLPTLFSQIKKIYDISDDFAFLDFTGEVMEFGVYQDGSIKDFISVRYGKNKIIREIVSKNIAKDFIEAKYIFSLYLQKNLDTDLNNEIQKIIDKNISEISSEIKSEISKDKKIHIPKKVFMISSGEMNYLLKDLSIFSETYFIGKSFLKNFVIASEDKYFDNFLALEAEYIFEK